MAIRVGMSVAEAIMQLTKGFKKMMGRDPSGLEQIKIKQEAMQRVEDLNKVVDMEGNVIDTSKGIMGGKQIQDSPEFGKRIKEKYDAAKGPGKGQEMVDAMKSPGARKSYEIIEDQLGVKLYGDESFEEILQIQKTGKHPRGEPKADGGRIGLKDGPKLSDFIDVQASGSKSGRKQLQGAPEGITIDNESFNAIAKADIPISQKVDLLLKYQYGKGRNKIERDGQEIFLGEGGFKDRDIGFGFNKDGEGIGGTLMYNMETGKPQFTIGLKKSFADGGRIGLKAGMTRRAFMKLMGAAGAGIGAAKTGLMTLGKNIEPATEVVKETVTKAPEYFFALMDKIRRFGKSVDDVTADPRVERTYQYKDYELKENAFGEPGEMVITKKTDMGPNGYKEESMRYKKGGSTEDGMIADEYEELTIRPDREGKLKDVEEGIEDASEIIEEATKSAPPIKKAAGGLAYMLGE